MTTIEVEKRDIKASPEKVFAFIADFNNYEELMPESVEDWESTQDKCSFQVSMIPKIFMEIADRQPHEKVKIKGSGPFDFDLTVIVEETSDEACKTGMIFEADINAFMKMMIEKPMGQFFGHLTKKVQAKFDAES